MTTPPQKDIRMKRPALPFAIATVSDAYDTMTSFDEREFNDAIAELMAQFEHVEAGPVVLDADADDAAADDDLDADSQRMLHGGLRSELDSAVDADASATAIAVSAATPREKSLLQYVGVALSASVLLLVLGLAAVVIAIPALVGGSALTVLTQSMEPGFPPGTLVVIKPTPVSDIRVGDVLTYQIKSGEAAVVSHRVVSKSVGSDGQTSFTTKGDNNDVADPNVVREVQIQGTLWYSVPMLGHLNTAINGEARGVVIPVAATVLFLYALWMVIGSIRDHRKKVAALRVGIA